MNTPKLTLLLALLALLVADSRPARALVAGARPAQAETLSKRVRVGSKTTYFDLLRELFPDLSADASAHESVPLRDLSEPRKKSSLAGDISFEFKPYEFNSAGRRLLMLWVELKAEGANEATPYEGESVVLAVYSLEPAPKFLDALGVKTDRFTGFWRDRPLLRLDARNDAFVIHNTHSNAGESYDDLSVLFVDEGKIKTVMSLFLYDTQGCGVGYTQTPEFRAVADPGNEYPKLFVRVGLKKERDEPSCEHPTRGYTRYYEGVFRWNAARRKYVGGSHALDRLDKFNARRVSAP